MAAKRKNSVRKEVWLPNDETTWQKRIVWLDASEVFRPEGKDKENFRIFDAETLKKDPIMSRVFQLYTDMHNEQTVEFNVERRMKWLKFDHMEMEIMDALELLHRFIDQSDPDIDLPNIVHAYQTAERIREEHPEEDWFHLTGLIHDLGKVMGIWGEQQFAVAGDTFVVGCAPGDSIVLRDSTFLNNPDLNNNKYNTKYGMYEPNCGLDNVMMSWGHDEYCYNVLKNHPKCRLPEEALYIIRFHSFYPWHTGGDYWHLCNDKDKDMLHWINEFNKYDLYSKTDTLPDIEELKPYYQSLVDKYLPGKIKW